VWVPSMGEPLGLPYLSKHSTCANLEELSSMRAVEVVHVSRYTPAE